MVNITSVVFWRQHLIDISGSLCGVILIQYRVYAPEPTAEMDSSWKRKRRMVQVPFLYQKWKSSYALTMVSLPLVVF